MLVLSGDVPRVEASMLTELIEQRRLDDAAMAMTVVAVTNRRGLGRVVRNEAGGVERIVEEKDATDEERETPRSTPGCTRSTPLGCVGGSGRSSRRRRPASCT